MRAPARRLPVFSATALMFASLTLVIGCDPPKKAQTREILGKRTQDIRDAPTEAAKGAVETKPFVPVSDPITQSTNTYVFAISRTSELLIEQAIGLYHAEKGEYPKDTKQFMDEVVKPNNIALPTLPTGQEYAYQPDTHKLVIMKYPGGQAPAAPK